MKSLNSGRSEAPRVALVSGFWGQNIGNAFFNVGGKWLLEQVFGASEVTWIQDQPGYRTFHNQAAGNPLNDAGLLQYLDVDYIVLQGPLFTRSFRSLWADTFRALVRRNTKIIMLGAAFFKYTDEEKRVAESMLSEFPPVVLSTRDSDSFNILNGMVEKSHDGLDSAFFVPRAYSAPDLSLRDYYVFAFDRFPEPSVSFDPATKGNSIFELEGRTWTLKLPAVQNWFSHRGKAWAYFGHAVDFRRLPLDIDGHVILRPEHRSNPHIGWKVYRQKNSLSSDEPYTYFTVYAHAALTLSDRVHACVMTLAYGGQAMLFSPSPRGSLFARVGASDIRNRPVSVDPDWLRREQDTQLAFLRETLSS